jgi:methyl-accepting chemotaxis protein-1 (serine sensor receptor)
MNSHREFHEEAGKVARTINRGASDVAEKMLANDSDFSRVSNKVSRLLVQLIGEVKNRGKAARSAASSSGELKISKMMNTLAASASTHDNGDWETF